MVFGLSHAEITKVCEDCIKLIILEDTKLTTQMVEKYLKQRSDVYVSKGIIFEKTKEKLYTGKYI